MSKPNPIAVGGCCLITEAARAAQNGSGRFYPAFAGVRIMQPSSGGDEAHYVPPSDVYLCLNPVELQNLAAYFSELARQVQEIKP